jgi:hypothetical protein
VIHVQLKLLLQDSGIVRYLSIPRREVGLRQLEDAEAAV